MPDADEGPPLPHPGAVLGPPSVWGVSTTSAVGSALTPWRVPCRRRRLPASRELASRRPAPTPTSTIGPRPYEDRPPRRSPDHGACSLGMISETKHRAAELRRGFQNCNPATWGPATQASPASPRSSRGREARRRSSEISRKARLNGGSWARWPVSAGTSTCARRGRDRDRGRACLPARSRLTRATSGAISSGARHLRYLHRHRAGEGEPKVVRKTRNDWRSLTGTLPAVDFSGEISPDSAICSRVAQSAAG